MCDVDGQWEAAGQRAELSRVLCDDRGRGAGGRGREAGDVVYTQLVHTVVQQKLTQHWKAVIL